MRAGDHVGRRADSGGLPQLFLGLILLPFIPLLSCYSGFLVARGLFNDYDNGLILPFGVGLLLLALLLLSAVRQAAIARWPFRQRMARWLANGMLLVLPCSLGAFSEIVRF